jgi:hypothetical protein
MKVMENEDSTEDGGILRCDVVSFFWPVVPGASKDGSASMFKVT